MKLSAQMTMVMGAIFAVICFAVAVNGFSALGTIADAQQLADARGYAWFWAFLGAVATIFAVLGWWVARGESGP